MAFQKKDNSTHPVHKFLFHSLASYRFISLLFSSSEPAPTPKNALPTDLSSLSKLDRIKYKKTFDFIVQCSNTTQLNQKSPERQKLISNSEPIKKAVSELVAKLPNHPAIPQIKFQFIHACEQDYESSFSLMLEAIRKKELWHENYIDFFLQTIRKENYTEYFNRLRHLAPLYAENYVEANQVKNINKWVESDVYKMIYLTKAHNAVPVIANYPRMRSGKAREIDELLKNIALKNKILFADISEVFGQIHKKDTQAEQKYYSYEIGFPTEHLNGDGYKIVAETIFPLVKPLAKKR